MLEHRAGKSDWESALAALESHIAAKLIDKETGARQKAVLETAIALDKADRAPDEALRLTRQALAQGARPRAGGVASRRVLEPQGRYPQSREGHRDEPGPASRIPISPKSISICGRAIPMPTAWPRRARWRGIRRAIQKARWSSPAPLLPRAISAAARAAMAPLIAEDERPSGACASSWRSWKMPNSAIKARCANGWRAAPGRRAIRCGSPMA